MVHLTTKAASRAYQEALERDWTTPVPDVGATVGPLCRVLVGEPCRPDPRDGICHGCLLTAEEAALGLPFADILALRRIR